jgi:hypothetical protein
MSGLGAAGGVLLMNRWFDKREDRWEGSNPSPSAGRTAKHSEYHLSVPADEALALVVEALTTMRAAVVDTATAPDGMVVRGMTRPTGRSLGERLRVWITKDGEGVRVLFESRPRISTTLVDYGAGGRNVRRFGAAMLGGAQG